MEVAYKFPEIKLGLDQETKDSLSAFIYRGKEDEQMDYKACAADYKAFPEFPDIQKLIRLCCQPLFAMNFTFIAYGKIRLQMG